MCIDMNKRMSLKSFPKRAQAPQAHKRPAACSTVGRVQLRAWRRCPCFYSIAPCAWPCESVVARVSTASARAQYDAGVARAGLSPRRQGYAAVSRRRPFPRSDRALTEAPRLDPIGRVDLRQGCAPCTRSGPIWHRRKQLWYKQIQSCMHDVWTFVHCITTVRKCHDSEDQSSNSPFAS